MSEDALCILLADDDSSMRELLARYLRNHHNYIVDTVASGEEALSLLKASSDHYDVALLDQSLNKIPDRLTGLDVLKEIKAHYSGIEVILFTAYGMDSALEALRAGAYRYFAKPFDRDELAFTVRVAAEHGQARRERNAAQAVAELSAIGEIKDTMHSIV